MAREARPADDSYYEPLFRSDLLGQGDLFADVPCGYPSSAQDLADVPGARRLFHSGPLPAGFALLITPSCSMGGESGMDGSITYDHPVRSLVPVLPIAQLEALEVLNDQRIDAARRHDDLINYIYLPAHGPSGMPESLGLLYLPISLDHDLLIATGIRVAQLAQEGARQLARKLAWFWSTAQIPREALNPPLD